MGGQSTVSTWGGSTINTVEVIASFVDLGGLMITVERINSKLKLSREKVIASCVDLVGVGGGDWWLLLRGSTVNLNFHMKRWSPHVLILGEGGLMITVEKINSKLTFMWKGDCLMYNQCREDQQAIFTFTWKGDHLMCWSWGGGSMIAVEEDQQSTFNFHMKRRSPHVLILGGGEDQGLLLRGSTVNFIFHMKRRSPHVLILGGGRIDNCCWEDQQSPFFHYYSKDLTYFSCM